MARLTPRAVLLVTFAALLVAFATLAPLASAQGATNTTGNATAPAGLPPYDYAITFRQGSENPFTWDITALNVPANSRILAVYNSTGATGQHNVAFDVGGQTIRTGLPIDGDSGSQASPVFTMPASGTVSYICQVHPEMTGTLTVASPFGGGGAGGAGHITHEGVNFLAHWVGVIAFATLFIIYGVTFFLFKYNETPFTTDHKDRAVPAGSVRTESYGEPFLTKRENVVVIGILLAALAIGLAIALARGLIG